MALRAFWVILVGETPTSFRAKMREDLVPTLRQLQRTQTDVRLRWFERGRIWESPQQAIGVAKLAGTVARERRPKEWRPGGEHRDPRARFELTRDQKRAKFKREQREDRSEDRPRERSHDRPKDRPADRPSDRPRDRSQGRSDQHARPDRRARPDRPGRPDRPNARQEPSESPFGPRKPRAPREQRPDGPRPGRKPRDRSDSDRSPFASRGPKRPWNKELKPRSESPFGERRPQRPRGEGQGRPDRRGGFKPPKRRP